MRYPTNKFLNSYHFFLQNMVVLTYFLVVSQTKMLLKMIGFFPFFVFFGGKKEKFGWSTISFLYKSYTSFIVGFGVG